MNWYLAKVVYRIICGDGDHAAQFDEQLRLVSANNIEEAFQKSREMGKAEEDSFYNRREQLVQWNFINVSEIYEIQEMIDGAELYSRIEERDNGYAYINIINQKANNLLSNSRYAILESMAYL